MGESTEELETGEIPGISYRDDGKFLETFLKQQQTGEPIATVDMIAVDNKQGDAEAADGNPPMTETVTDTQPPSQQPADTETLPSTSTKDNQAAVLPNQKVAPPAVLQSKRPIVQIRGRKPDDASAQRKKQKSHAKGDDKKSKYQLEMERYKQISCDSSKDTGRPLVK